MDGNQFCSVGERGFHLDIVNHFRHAFHHVGPLQYGSAKRHDLGNRFTVASGFQHLSRDQGESLPAEFYKAGVKFAFGTFNNEFSRNLPYNAARAAAYGLPQEEALKAITINGAQIWGASDRVGSIEKGKWADLMVTTGDPLETPTQVTRAYVQGRAVDLSNRQKRLWEKYQEKYRRLKK